MELLEEPGKGLGIKNSYTQDENYRAYKLFSMMDVDGGGSISLRELNRVLMGEVIRFVSCDFDHPDTGIVFGLDEENCVAIIDIEPRSAAAAFPFLIERMRLYQIDDIVVKQHDKKSLQAVYEELLRIHDEPLTFSFHEPILIINKFSCAIDIEMDGDIHTVMLPIGAIYSAEVFCSRLHDAMAAVDPVLESITVAFNAHKRQITFKSASIPFRLLFASGKNCRRSCRYSFGFSAVDTAFDVVHVGQPMYMNLNLGISQAKMEILMRELFEQFDRDGSGEFEFEEFRDFYIKYLDTEESLDRLRKYAQYRFRDVERERFVLQQQHERKLRNDRRRYLKKKNKEVVAGQKRTFYEDSYKDAFNIRRRKYHHRTNDNLMSRNQLNKVMESTLPQGDEHSQAEQESVLSSIGEGAIKPKQDELMAREERLEARRNEMKEKQHLQAERRRKVLEKILEANLELKKKEKKLNAQHVDDLVTTQLMELQFQIKRRLIESMKMASNTEFEKIASFGVTMDRIITSPAVTVHEGILSNALVPSPDVIEVAALPSSKVHPAMMNYYCMKENHKDLKEVFNAEYLHPAFFTADYVRQPSRHSYVALSLARVMKAKRSEGVQFRAEQHITRCYDFPPEDDLPIKTGNKIFKTPKRKDNGSNLLRTKKVSFIDMEVNRFNKPKNSAVIARLTVVSIKVRNLASLSILQKNSPFVSLQCGETQFTTEVYSFAGRQCEWVELQWMFRLNRKDKLKLVASSGSVLNPQCIGSSTITAEEIMLLPTDSDNYLTLSGQFHNGSGEDASSRGDFQMRVFMEKGEEWDWFVQSCDTKQKEQHARQHQIRKFSRYYCGDMSADSINFPFTIRINRLNVLDLKLNLWKQMAGNVHVVMETNDTALSTLTVDGDKKMVSEAGWDGLNWTIPVVSSEMNVVFNVYAGKGSLLGKHIVSGLDIMHMISSTQTNFEILGDIKDYSAMSGSGGVFKGKLMANGEVLSDRSKGNTAPISISKGSEFVQLPSVVTIEAIDVDVQDHWYAANKRKFAAVEVSVSTGHRKFSCGSVPVASNNTKSVHFSFHDLTWDLPLRSRSLIACTLTCKGDQSMLGTMSLRSDELLAIKKTDISEDSSALKKSMVSHIELNRYLYCAQTLVGKVTICAQVSHELESEHIDRMIAGDVPIVSPVMNMQSLLPDEVQDEKPAIKGAPAAQVNNSVKFQALGTMITEINPENIVFPVRITIIEVMLTDVRNVHIFAKNSLLVTIACGTMAESTSMQRNIGQHCQWIGLELAIIVHESNALRFCIKSSNVIIGEVQLSNTTVIESRPDKAGIRELMAVFGSDAHPNGGKMRIKYYLDNVQAVTVPTTSIPHYKGQDNNNTLSKSNVNNRHIRSENPLTMEVDYPNLLVIYHISFMGLPAVHRFAKNSPGLKLRYWYPGAGPVDLSTEALPEAGGFGKWMNLVWEIVLSGKDDALLVQIVSDSIVIGEAIIKSQQLFKALPNQFGICQMDVVLFEDEPVVPSVEPRSAFLGPGSLEMQNSKSFLTTFTNLSDAAMGMLPTMKEARGTLRLIYTTEPYVAVEDMLDYDRSLTESSAAKAVDLEKQSSLRESSFLNTVIVDHSLNSHSLYSVNTDEMSVGLPPSRGRKDDELQRDYAKQLFKLHSGEVWSVNIQHMLFALQGSSRIKKFMGETLINVQLVCGNFVSSVQLCETQSQRFHSSNLDLSFAMHSSFTMHVRLYDINNHDIGAASFDLTKLFDKSKTTSNNGEQSQYLCEEKVLHNGSIFMGQVRMRVELTKATNNDDNTSATVYADTADVGVPQPRVKESIIGPVASPSDPIQPPFLLTIERIVAFDVTLLQDMLERYDRNPNKVKVHLDSHQSSEVLLIIKHGSMIVSVQGQVVEGIDDHPDRIVWEAVNTTFPVTSMHDSWDISVNISSKFAGSVVMSTADWQMAYISSKVHVTNSSSPGVSCDEREYYGFLRPHLVEVIKTGKQHSMGYLIASFKMAPIVKATPLFPAVPLVRDAVPVDIISSQTRFIGSVRVLAIAVFDLLNVYELFINSPQVVITMGPHFSMSTEAAVEAGNEFTWDHIVWPSIPIYEYLSGKAPDLVITVKSNNEVIGWYSMKFESIIEHVMTVAEVVDLQASLVTHNGDYAGEVVVSCVASKMADQPDLHAASLLSMISQGIPAPERAVVSVVQCIVTDLVQLSSSQPNSPQIEICYCAFCRTSEVHGFSGSRADWLFSREKGWQFVVGNKEYVSDPKAVAVVSTSLSSDDSHSSLQVVRLTLLSDTMVIGYCLVHINKLLTWQRDANDMITFTADLQSFSPCHGYPTKCGMIQVTFQVQELESIMGNVDSEVELKNDLPLAISLPISVVVIKVVCEDVHNISSYTPHAMQLRISTRNVTNGATDNQRMFNQCEKVGTNVYWPMVCCTVALQEEKHNFCLELLSNRQAVLGTASIAPSVLLQYRRTSHGCVEVVLDLLNEKRTNLIGKARCTLLLTSFQSFQDIYHVLTRCAETTKPMSGSVKMLRFKLLTIQGVTVFHPKLSVMVTSGSYMECVPMMRNMSGTIVINPDKWKTVPLSSKSLLTITLLENRDDDEAEDDATHVSKQRPSDNKNKLASVTFPTYKLITAARRDERLGVNVIFADMIFGVVPVAQLSMSFEFLDEVKPTSEAVEEPPQVVVQAEPLYPTTLSDGTMFMLEKLSTYNMLPVHKQGKNSPMFSVEYLGQKYLSSSLAYTGAKAAWEDIHHTLKCKNRFSVTVRLTSASVLIGAATINISDLYLLVADVDGRFHLERKLVKNGKTTGMADLYFRILPSATEGWAKAYSVEKGIMSGSAESFKVVPFDKRVSFPASPSKSERSRLDGGELQRTLRRNVNDFLDADDEDSMDQSKFMIHSLGSYSDQSTVSGSYTSYSRSTDYSDSHTLGTSLASGYASYSTYTGTLASVDESSQLSDDGTFLSGMSKRSGDGSRSSRISELQLSVTTNAQSTFSNASSRPKTSRGADDASGHSKQSGSSHIGSCPSLSSRSGPADQSAADTVSSQSIGQSTAQTEGSFGSTNQSGSRATFSTSQSASQVSHSLSYTPESSTASRTATSMASSSYPRSSQYTVSQYTSSAYTGDHSQSIDEETSFDGEESYTPRSEITIDSADYSSTMTGSVDVEEDITEYSKPLPPLGHDNLPKVHFAALAAAMAPKISFELPKVFAFQETLRNTAQCNSLPVNQRLALLHSQVFVTDLVDRVIQSFVAMETGQDFQDVVPKHASKFNPLLRFTDPKRTLFMTAVRVAEDAIIAGGSRVLDRRLNPVIKQQIFAPSKYKKREGIMMFANSAAESGSVVLKESSLTDQFRFETLIRNGKEIRIPLRARLTILDIIGLDLSPIDLHVMPLKPYIVACKPYGNWYAETPVQKIDIKESALIKEKLMMNYYGLSTRYKWESFVLRTGQYVVFDIYDGNSGLIVAKCSLPYEEILNKNCIDNQMEAEASVFIGFDIAAEYGGGRTGGVVRLRIDLSVNIYKNTKKSPEHWDAHRSQHWQSYPLIPICFGVIRQKYRDVAEEYDRQMLVHPAFFGFKARFRGNQEDEGRFKHPAFISYSLLKKNLVNAHIGSHRNRGNQSRKVNPFKWDPSAAARGRCPVCSDGQPGCPRCYMLPKHETGASYTPGEFAFDPEVEVAKEKKKQQKLIEISARKTRRLSSIQWPQNDAILKTIASKAHASTADDDSSISTTVLSHVSEQIIEEYEREKEEILKGESKLAIHTILTTSKSVREYRNAIQSHFIVYIKVMPVGYIKKVVMERKDSIVTLYHMFASNSKFGSEHGSMILLPTSAGLFELHPELSIESDVYIADKRGRDKLEDFFLRDKGGEYVLLYLHRYHTAYLPKLLKSFVDANTKSSLADLPVYTGVDRIPNDLRADSVQKYLSALIIDHFRLQQIEELKTYRGLAEHYKQTNDVNKLRMDKVRVQQKKDREKQRKDHKRRLQSQLKRFDQASRESVERAMSKREERKNKRQVVRVDEKDWTIPEGDEDFVSVSDVNLDDYNSESDSQYSEDSEYSDEMDELDQIAEGDGESEDEEEEDEEGVEVLVPAQARSSENSIDSSTIMQGSAASALRSKNQMASPRSPRSARSVDSARSLFSASDDDPSFYSTDSSYTPRTDYTLDSARSSSDGSYSSRSYASSSSYGTSFSGTSASSRSSLYSNSTLSSLLPIDFLQLHHYPSESAATGEEEESDIFDKDDDQSLSTIYSGARTMKRERSAHSGIYSARSASTQSSYTDDLSEDESTPRSALSEDDAASSVSGSTGGGLFTYRSNISSQMSSANSSSVAHHLWHEDDVDETSQLSQGYSLDDSSYNSMQSTASSSSALSYSSSEGGFHKLSTIMSESSRERSSWSGRSSSLASLDSSTASKTKSSRSSASRSVRLPPRAFLEEVPAVSANSSYHTQSSAGIASVDDEESSVADSLASSYTYNTHSTYSAQSSSQYTRGTTFTRTATDASWSSQHSASTYDDSASNDDRTASSFDDDGGLQSVFSSQPEGSLFSAATMSSRHSSEDESNARSSARSKLSQSLDAPVSTAVESVGRNTSTVSSKHSGYGYVDG